MTQPFVSMRPQDRPEDEPWVGSDYLTGIPVVRQIDDGDPEPKDPLTTSKIREAGVLLAISAVAHLVGRRSQSEPVARLAQGIARGTVIMGASEAGFAIYDRLAANPEQRARSLFQIAKQAAFGTDDASLGHEFYARSGLEVVANRVAERVSMATNGILMAGDAYTPPIIDGVRGAEQGVMRLLGADGHSFGSSLSRAKSI